MSEVDILGRLSHPNIIRLVHPWFVRHPAAQSSPSLTLHDSFVEHDVLHIFTDYADQGDLNTKLAERVCLPPR
jgi:hypothetical protein